MTLASFNSVLQQWCGITQVQAQDAINDHGYTKVEDLANLTEKEIIYLVKDVNKLSPVTVQYQFSLKCKRSSHNDITDLHVLIYPIKTSLSD